jgi:(p)ppGpp synthase/HD superfamily hydrolase
MDYLTMARDLAYKYHANQYDKGGNDYINHIESVVNGVEEDICKTVAYLHDIVEDTEITFKDLEDYGFSNEIIEATKLLTKDKNIDYFTYLSLIKNNDISRKVKISDLKNNSDLSRLNIITDKDIKRKAKYLKALAYLNN